MTSKEVAEWLAFDQVREERRTRETLAAKAVEGVQTVKARRAVRKR